MATRKTATKPATKKTATKRAGKPATKKATKPNAPAAKPKKKTPKAAKTAVTPKAVNDRLVHEILGSLPQLSPGLRAAFASRFTEAQCEAWGTKTKAEAVLREATVWAGTIDRVLEAHKTETDSKGGNAGVVRRPVGGYSISRFTFFCETVGALADAVDAQKAAGASPADAGAAVRAAVAAAVPLRKRLANRLVEIAGGDANLLAEVREVRGADKPPHALATSLSDLADLATTWSKRSTDLALLLADAGIGDGALHDARAAAGRVDEALNARAREGVVTTGDTTATNRIEGRVLREMRVAMTAFERAKEEGAIVPRLVPGPATRHVLAHSGGDDAAPEAPPESAPPATGTAEPATEAK